MERIKQTLKDVNSGVFTKYPQLRNAVKFINPVYTIQFFADRNQRHIVSDDIDPASDRGHDGWCAWN